jgi:hypothetical protein
MQWLSRWQRRQLAVPVVYERVASPDVDAFMVSAPAVLGRAGATSDESVDPMRLDADDVDFLIAAADLRVGGSMIEPCADDRVYCSRNGTTHVYEVLPTTRASRGGEKPWRWSDPQQTIRRIHARHVDDYPTPGGR